MVLGMCANKWRVDWFTSGISRGNTGMTGRGNEECQSVDRSKLVSWIPCSKTNLVATCVSVWHLIWPCFFTIPFDLSFAWVCGECAFLWDSTWHENCLLSNNEIEFEPLFSSLFFRCSLFPWDLNWNPLVWRLWWNGRENVSFEPSNMPSKKSRTSPTNHNFPHWHEQFCIKRPATVNLCDMKDRLSQKQHEYAEKRRV